MTFKDYYKLRDDLIEDAFEVSNKKGADYTVGSKDALQNFKITAERTGLNPLQVLGIYMMKHQDAVSSFIKNGGKVESEPIKERVIDNINYLCLLYALIKDLNLDE